MVRMTSLLKNRYLRIAGLALGAVAIAGVAIAVTASAAGMSFGFQSASSSPSPAPHKSPAAPGAQSTACTDFMQHFATDLGKSQAQVNVAFQKAIADTLADQVKSGQLTQAQADEIKAKLAKQTPCTLPRTAPHPPGEKGALGATMQQYLTAAAAALGISETELKTDLANGQSLSQVAAAHNVTEAQFRTKLIANLTPTLDAAVAGKTITAAQEQEILNRLQTGPLPLWNLPARKPKPAASPAPTT